VESLVTDSEGAGETEPFNLLRLPCKTFRRRRKSALEPSYISTTLRAIAALSPGYVFGSISSDQSDSPSGSSFQR
jgi:hypothetical protein